MRNVPIITDSAGLEDEMNAANTIQKKAGILLKNIQSFGASSIRLWLQQMYSSDVDDAMNSTNFKRCVMYLDLVENKL